MQTKRIAKQVNSIAALLIIFGIVVAVNVLFSGLRLRGDFTEDKLYTLSEGTRSILSGLERDVTVKLYVSHSMPGAPTQLKQLGRQVEELLREYALHSGGKLVLETYDPRPDSDEEEWAQRYGLAGRPLDLLGQAPPFYLGLVAVSGAREAAIPFLSPEQESRMEYLLTQLVYEVTRGERPKIGILSSLPVMGMQAMPFMQNPQGRAPWLFVQQLRRLYDVQEISATGGIPDGLTALLLVQPKQLSPQTAYAIDQYLLRGGRLFAFADPMALTDDTSMRNPQAMMMGGDFGEFTKLLQAWGVQLDPTQVVGDLSFDTTLDSREVWRARNISWLNLPEEGIDRSDVATEPLRSVLLPLAGSIGGEAPEGLSRVVLLQSSAQSGLLNAMSAQFSEDGGVRELVSDTQQHALAVRLSGRFRSAYPEGRPESETPEAGEVPPRGGLLESEKEGAVVLVSDVDMLFDQFCVRASRMFGEAIYEPINDNLSFVLNLTEQLAGSQDLIGLRSRGRFDRPFTLVRELEEKAQERWRMEEQTLSAKLAETQSRLSEIQATKDPTQRMILSPEQEAEIRRFEEQVVETQQALREVRRNLTRDIEQLGLRLKVLNIAAMPLAVAVIGLFIGLRRRSHS